MKIKINESESYEIEIPEEVDGESLRGLIDRLFRIQKLLVKDVLSEVSSGEKGFNGDRKPRGTYRNYAKWRNDRELSVKLLKSYYSEDKEIYHAFRKEMNIDKGLASSIILTFKTFHKIHPNEVGLIKWPTTGEYWRDLRLTEKEVENGGSIEAKEEEETEAKEEGNEES